MLRNDKCPKLIARMNWDSLVNVSHTIEIHTHAIKFNDD